MPNNRITERRYRAVSSQTFTVDGTVHGVVTIANTINFKVKQKVILTASGQSNIELQIQQVLSDTQFVVGPIGSKIQDVHDISAYTTAASAAVFLNEQQRPVIPEQEITRIIYEEEPTLAHRNVLVDWLGNYYTIDNPLPVQLSDGSIEIGTVNAELEVQLSHIDDYPDVGDVHDSVRVGDGTDLLEINADGSINVHWLPGNVNPIIYTNSGSFTNTNETIVATYTSTSLNEKIAVLLGDAETFGIWRIYRGASINPSNLAAVTRTSPTSRNTEIKFTEPEILSNIGDKVTVSFQAERYRSAFLGGSASTFVRLEGYVS